MIKLMYELGCAIVCSILCCSFTLIAITATLHQGAMPDCFIFMAAVFMGSTMACVNMLLISMAESLGFWPSLSIKSYLLSGIVFGLLLGFCVSGPSLAQALGLGILISLATSLGSWIGMRAAVATTTGNDTTTQSSINK